MRKKTIKHLFDTIFWYIIYLLPIIFMVLAWFRGNTEINLNSTFLYMDEYTQLGFGFLVAETNPFFVALVQIFSPIGVFPLFSDGGIFLYLSYFMSCWVIHLAVDVLLFIVRWAHSMIDGFLGGKHD